MEPIQILFDVLDKDEVFQAQVGYSPIQHESDYDASCLYFSELIFWYKIKLQNLIRLQFVREIKQTSVLLCK